MGYTVAVEFRPVARHPAAFWWPLLFEAARRRGMSYSDPGFFPAHLGRYQATDEASGLGFHQASFRALWERLSDATSRFRDIVSFRTGAFPLWDLTMAIGESRGHGSTIGEVPPPQEAATTLRCWTDDLNPDDSLLTSEIRLSVFVAIACQVADLCGPGTGEFTYEHDGVVYRFGTIGQPLELAWWASPTQTGTYDAPIARTMLSSGQEVAVITHFQPTWSPGPIEIYLPEVPPPADAHGESAS